MTETARPWEKAGNIVSMPRQLDDGELFQLAKIAHEATDPRLRSLAISLLERALHPLQMAYTDSLGSLHHDH